MGCIDSSCKLEGLVVEVKIVLKFGSEEDGSQGHLMDIEVVESELVHFHVIPVDIDDGDDEALC